MKTLKLTSKQLYIVTSTGATILVSLISVVVSTTLAKANMDNRIVMAEESIKDLQTEMGDIARNYSYVPERLARVETKIDSVNDDIKQIKSLLMHK